MIPATSHSDYTWLTHVRPEALPPQVQQFIAIIGLDAALRFVAEYGGRVLIIPQGRTPETAAARALMIEVIGEANFDKLFGYYDRTAISVPLCLEALRGVRDGYVLALSDAGKTVDEIVVALRSTPFRLTERQVWRVRKRADIAAADAAQLSLFG